MSDIVSAQFMVIIIIIIIILFV